MEVKDEERRDETVSKEVHKHPELENPDGDGLLPRERHDSRLCGHPRSTVTYVSHE